MEVLENAKKCTFPTNVPNFLNRVSNERSHSTDECDNMMELGEK